MENDQQYSPHDESKNNCRFDDRKLLRALRISRSVNKWWNLQRWIEIMTTQQFSAGIRHYFPKPAKHNQRFVFWRKKWKQHDTFRKHSSFFSGFSLNTAEWRMYILSSDENGTRFIPNDYEWPEGIRKVIFRNLEESTALEFFSRFSEFSFSKKEKQFGK